MKKILVAAVASVLIAPTLGCSLIGKTEPTPAPAPTNTTLKPITPAEQKCFDDDIAAIRAMRKDPDHNLKRPESCNNLVGGERRFREIHELALLKVEANG